MLKRQILRPAALFLIAAVASSCGGGGGYDSPTSPASEPGALVAAPGFQIVTVPLQDGGEIRLAVHQIAPPSGGTIFLGGRGSLEVDFTFTVPSSVEVFAVFGLIPAAPLEVCVANFFCEPGPGFDGLPWLRASVAVGSSAVGTLEVGTGATSAATPDVAGVMIGLWVYSPAEAPEFAEGPPHQTVVLPFTWLTL